ncbi:hypothetical protein V6N13_123567 [Hibiscus sabdariffa]|uniref:Uncharacterized protein n=1 Tax=Hibiscus sabdariffa TaxID=183260 RepID=A0ABR2QTN5_9ROSI
MDFCLQSLPSFSQVLKEIKSKIRRTKSYTPNRSPPDELCYRISLSDIKAATNNFHKTTIIGKGDTWFIYEGEINGGFYAIKRLMPTTDSHLPLME